MSIPVPTQSARRVSRQSLSRASVRLVAAIALAGACRGAPPASSHPLDPLSAAEITVTEDVLRARGLLTPSRRVMTLDLQEPRKADVLAARAVPRHSFALLYDARKNETMEVSVNIGARTVLSARVVPGVEPALDDVDAARTDAIVRGDSTWRAALARRGLRAGEADVLAWTAGNFDTLAPPRDRMVHAVTYAKATRANEMARPVEGLWAEVNLTSGVMHVRDEGVIPVPDAASEAAAWRPLPSPLTAEPPASAWTDAAWDGAGVPVNGHEVRWHRWRFRVAIHAREGMVLYDAGFDDGTGVRPVMYRASLSEMVVPYGDPGPGWYYRNSFDAGELGIGAGVARLRAGTDCPRNATLMDAVLADDRGRPRTRQGAIALFERDGGIAWKHGDDVRRARELVVYSMSRLGNYDYGFEWIFHEDGTLEHRVLLTGVMSAKAVKANHVDAVSDAVAPGIAAVHHQHFFNYRLDLDIDGATPNHVEEVEMRAMTAGAHNPHGGGFVASHTMLATEQAAKRRLDAPANRRWRIVNLSARGASGARTAYELVPGVNAEPLASAGALLRRRAGFLDAAFWATPYRDDERFAAGDYPNQSRGAEGLPKWTSANRPVSGDVVVWYTLGITHHPRPEDWPVMPVHEAGFRLVPTGFFARNPVLDRQ